MYRKTGTSLAAMDRRPRQARFQRLLDEFEKQAAVVFAPGEDPVSGKGTRFQKLLRDYDRVVEKWSTEQKSEAPGFNVLELLDIIGDEVRHSILLAWLVDHDIRNFGTHAQGNLGFQVFLKECGLPAGYAVGAYDVRREVRGFESRIDVRIEARGRFVIDVENKVSSDEGEEQTNREWNDLLRRAKHLSVPKAATHALFLTPDVRKAENPGFRRISYKQIAAMLDEFSALAEAPMVSLFAAHYSQALRRYVITKSSESETLT